MVVPLVQVLPVRVNWSKMNNIIKKNSKLILFVLIIILLYFASNLLKLGDKLNLLRHWISTLGVWAPFIYIIIYALATVFLLSGFAMTVIAGALFGTVNGVIIVSIASTTGASLSFLVARYIGRQYIEQWLNKQEKFHKLDELTRKYGSNNCGYYQG